jgi:drug/metabolite transporter (DMT)-like permease
VDVPALLLLFWLMQHMSATRMTTRFLIAPLLANIAGLLFLRPEVSLLEWMGLALITAGAAWLLFAPQDETDATSSLNLR